MELVADDEDRRYVLEKRSSDAWLVRSLETGEPEYLQAEALTVLGDEDSPPSGTGSVPDALQELLRSVEDHRTLSLLELAVDRETVSVRELLGATTLCESDLHGALAELNAAGYLEETTVAGERAYEATEQAEAAVAALDTE